MHSRYVRRRADTAVAGRPGDRVTGPSVRCRDSPCRQATFAEQVNGLTFRHGRRSTGLQTVLQQGGLGMDEFALRKRTQPRHDLVNIDTRRPVDLP
ncbi:hypothetical protein SNL152K_10216 [Streptomyces sp. NL15-2K]|nr:hypothetical protein SNL152K_10216 [Streptomyces sp. NL15-2K]